MHIDQNDFPERLIVIAAISISFQMHFCLNTYSWL